MRTDFCSSLTNDVPDVLMLYNTTYRGDWRVLVYILLGEFETSPLWVNAFDNGPLQKKCCDPSGERSCVECKHIHIVNVARALRFQAHLPIRFWGEYVLTAS